MEHTACVSGGWSKNRIPYLAAVHTLPATGTPLYLSKVHQNTENRNPYLQQVHKNDFPVPALGTVYIYHVRAAGIGRLAHAQPQKAGRKLLTCSNQCNPTGRMPATKGLLWNLIASCSCPEGSSAIAG